MKQASLTRRNRRAVVLGLAVVTPPLLYLGVGRPYVEALAETRDRTAIAREALARERGLLALAPRQITIQHALDSIVSVSQARLFSAPDDGIAAAELGTYLTQLAREHNVWLRAADPGESKTSPNGIRALPVAISAQSDFEGTRAFLRAMEQGPKLLTIDQLTIAPGTDTSASRPVVELRATVTGFALRGAAAPTPAAAAVAAEPTTQSNRR